MAAMHTIVPFAGASASALAGIELPNLARLLSVLEAGVRLDGDAGSFTPPHERAWADAVGVAGADGALPLAAVEAAADGLRLEPGAVALLTPVHWQVGRDHVRLDDPAVLGLDEAASRTLFDAMQPLFASEGYALHWGAPLRWYAVHDEFDGLRCASLDRAIGRPIEHWLPADPRARRIRRLQGEVQMLLHTHPLNEEREARGVPTVNSFWLSGCGRGQSPRAQGVRVEAALRASALAGDAAAWAEAWRGLDAGPIAALLDAATGGGAVAITLCGERHAQNYRSTRRSWWRRVASTWTRTDPHRLLEAL